jgi:putative transposase
LHAKIFASELGLQGDHSLLRTGEAIMPNHYHLQVETPRANLSRAIQWLNVGYSIWFNRKYNRSARYFRAKIGKRFIQALATELWALRFILPASIRTTLCAT